MKKELIAQVKTAIINEIQECFDIASYVKLSFISNVVANVVEATNYEEDEVFSSLESILDEMNILQFAFFFNIETAYDIPKAIAEQTRLYIKDWLENDTDEKYRKIMMENIIEVLEDEGCEEGCDLLESKGIIEILF